MLHSPVNRLGLGLVTLTGINALIFFLLHIITHAWGGEIERSLAALGRYGSSRLFYARRQGFAASRLPRVDSREGSGPQTGTLTACGKGERGMRMEERVCGGCWVRASHLGCGFAILFATRGGRTRHCAAADGAPVAASPVGFWCWGRLLGAGGTLCLLPPPWEQQDPGDHGARTSPGPQPPHLNGCRDAGMKLDGCPLRPWRGAGGHPQPPTIHPPIRLQLLPGNPNSAGLEELRQQLHTLMLSCYLPI